MAVTTSKQGTENIKLFVCLDAVVEFVPKCLNNFQVFTTVQRTQRKLLKFLFFFLLLVATTTVLFTWLETTMCICLASAFASTQFENKRKRENSALRDFARFTVQVTVGRSFVRFFLSFVCRSPLNCTPAHTHTHMHCRFKPSRAVPCRVLGERARRSRVTAADDEC